MATYCKNEYCDHSTIDEIECSPEDFECFICDRDDEELEIYRREYERDTEKDPCKDNIYMLQKIVQIQTHRSYKNKK